MEGKEGMSPPNGRFALMQERLYERVRQLYEIEYEEGTMTLNAIAEELNISLLELYDILKTLGLPLL